MEAASHRNPQGRPKKGKKADFVHTSPPYVTFIIMHSLYTMGYHCVCVYQLQLYLVWVFANAGHGLPGMCVCTLWMCTFPKHTH